jgi:hypothetical protein
MKTYVKEVQALIDLGYSERDAVKIFEAIVDHFERHVLQTVEVEDFQEKALELRKSQRAYYRDMINEALAWAQYDELTWREVKFEPKRVKRCAQCMGWFYDTSRNARKITCNRLGEYRQWDQTNREYRYYNKDNARLSVCGARYELARKPVKRRVQEISFDTMPSSEDAYGNVFMDEVENAHQRQLNPNHNEWTYWNR